MIKLFVIERKNMEKETWETEKSLVLWKDDTRRHRRRKNINVQKNSQQLSNPSFGITLWHQRKQHFIIQWTMFKSP